MSDGYGMDSSTQDPVVWCVWVPVAMSHHARLSKRDDTSTGTATRVARCGSLMEGLRWIGPPERKTLRTREMFVLLCVWCCSRLSWTCLALCYVQSFYSLRLVSYTMTQGPTGGPRVVETPYHRALMARSSKCCLQRRGVRPVLSSCHIAYGSSIALFCRDALHYCGVSRVGNRAGAAL
jgi:hypothetical protein